VLQTTRAGCGLGTSRYEIIASCRFSLRYSEVPCAQLYSGNFASRGAECVHFLPSGTTLEITRAWVLVEALGDTASKRQADV
jgi:hypothetical protein